MIVDIQKTDSIQHPCAFQDDDAEVYIENSTIGWIIHCYVHNWSKEVYYKLLEVLFNIADTAPGGEVYCISSTPKLSKFAQMFGFEVIDELYGNSKEKVGELLKYD